jgi:ubiquinone/menaquinone biosynthesis C-methylase UbiE
MLNVVCDKDVAELNFWKQLYSDFISGCDNDECKINKCLDVSRNITFKRYKNDLYLNDNDFASKKILDVGCGPNGGLIGFLDCEKYGIDHLICHYEKIGYPLSKHNIKYFDCKTEKMPFESDFFDAIICVNALDHVDSLELTIKEMTRVLHSNCKIFMQLNFREKPALTEPIVFNHDDLKDMFKKYNTEIVNVKYQYSLSSEKRFYYECQKN